MLPTVLRNPGGCGWAILDGVSFLMLVYFDKTAYLSVLSRFRWVLPQGKGVEGAYRRLWDGICDAQLHSVLAMLCGVCGQGVWRKKDGMLESRPLDNKQASSGIRRR